MIGKQTTSLTDPRKGALGTYTPSQSNSFHFHEVCSKHSAK